MKHTSVVAGARHGTLTGYINHKCRCEPCKLTIKLYMIEWRSKRGPADAKRHGSLSTYNAYGCRCVACRAVNAAYHRKYYRAHRKAAQ